MPQERVVDEYSERHHLNETTVMRNSSPLRSGGTILTEEQKQGKEEGIPVGTPRTM